MTRTWQYLAQKAPRPASVGGGVSLVITIALCVGMYLLFR